MGAVPTFQATDTTTPEGDPGSRCGLNSSNLSCLWCKMRRLSHINRHRRPTDVVLSRRALLVACFVALFPACAEKNTHDSGAPEPPVAVPGPPDGSLGSRPHGDRRAGCGGASLSRGDGTGRVEGFCIDRYEAHLVARVGGEVAPHPHFKRPEEGVTYEARSEPGVFPQAYVGRVESEAACTTQRRSASARGGSGNVRVGEGSARRIPTARVGNRGAATGRNLTSSRCITAPTRAAGVMRSSTIRR